MQRNPGLYWWVGLSWRSASLKRAWRETTAIARIVLRGMGLDERNYINRSNYEIRLPGLGEIWFRTGDNPSSLAGEGIHGAVVDEFSLMQEIVWTEYLEATLLDYHGWVAFGGVPKGLNWASQLWMKAEQRPEWIQVRATTYDNPFLKAADIDAIKTYLPTRYFEQEYLAQIVADGAFFQGVEQAATITAHDAPEQHKGHYICAGLDWALSEDFTALTIACRDCNRVIYWDRFNRMDYTYQREIIKDACKKYGVAALLPERNSIGQPNIEMLMQMRLSIATGPDGGAGFNTSATTKPQLILKLANALEHDGLKVPVEYADELRSYQVEVSATNPKFGAPEGQHDDRVISLALCWWAMTMYSRFGGIHA